MTSERRLRLGRLALLGLAIEAVYLICFVRSFPLARYGLIPRLDLGKLTGHEPLVTASVVLAVLFMLYALAYGVVQKERGSAAAALVFLYTIAFGVTLIFVYPIGGLDIFDYIFYGREMVAYHANPYLAAPWQFASDSLYTYVAWTWLPFTYGPIWALVSCSLNRIAQADVLLNLYLFKALAVVAYLAASILVYAVLRRHAPQRANAGMLLVAWNPLVVLESAVNGHNDALVVFFVVLGVWAFARGQRASAVGGLAASILTKFVTAPLTAIWLVAGWKAEKSARSRLIFIVTCAVLLLVLGIATFGPFVDELSQARTVVLAPVQRQDLFTSSLPALLVYGTRGWLGKERAEKIARGAAAVVLLLCTAYQAWKTGSRWQDVAAGSYNVLLAYLLVACLWFQPWYVMWIVPLAAMLPSRRAANTTIIFTFSALAKYLVFDFLWYRDPFVLDMPQIEAIAATVIYLPPFAYLIWSRRRQGARQQI